MSNEDRALAEDCWQAIAMLRHPTAQQAETPEWLAAAAAQLQARELPAS